MSLKKSKNLMLKSGQETHENDIFKYKIQQANKRGYFRTLDLFAGCGGLSLGFDRAGFKSVIAIEIDDDARASHQLNFGHHDDYAAFSDVTLVSPETATKHIQEDTILAVDIIIGGPPCQAYSRLGRARLWQLAGKKMAHSEDKRATMYEYYLEYIRQLKPIAFVMENVREIGKYVGRNIAEEISIDAQSMGYSVNYSLLNAVWYGVPQMRERTFIIGIHQSLGVNPSFPKITHDHKIPVGYSTSKNGRSELQFLPPNDHFYDNHNNRSIKRNAVTLGEAFADLPPIYYHLESKSNSKKAQNPDIETEYLLNSNEYLEEIKGWPNFESLSNKFSGHIIRNTPRDYNTFRHMPEGGMYPDAFKTALKLFNERISEIELLEKREIKRNSTEWNKIYSQVVPPYSIEKYPNKFRKLWKDQPSRTLPAHIGKDSYSHIHFDSAQARGISLREAARIQSFPDGFKFHGSMNSRLKQIGNAVPPLLAYAVAKNLKQNLKNTNQ